MNTAISTTVEAQLPTHYTARQVMDQVQIIQEVMRDAMKKDEHYGVIPGCGTKPALLKAGAEKLSLTFRLAPSYIVERVDMPNGHREYIITCELRHIETGKLFGAGMGSCSTMESKYRWRNGRLPDTVTDFDVPKEYWDKRKSGATPAQLGELLALVVGEPGKYATKKIDDQWKIIKRGEGSDERVENPDIADQYNTVLKMGKKRAHVDATLTALAASDIFTQDIEERLEPTEAVTVQATVVESVPTQPQEPPEERRTACRAWRAEVNKLGAKAKTIEQIEKAAKYFEEKMTAAGMSFDGFTYHKPEETFRDVLSVHRERVESQSPEAVAAWVGRIAEVKDVKYLAGFYKTYSTKEYCQTTDAEDALTAKVKEFGFASLDEYADSLEAAEAKA